MNYKILYSVFLVIILVGVIFGTVMSLYINIYDPEWHGLFSNSSNDDMKKRIFLIGSSSVYSIDSGYINNELSLNGKNYEMYNLADMSDTPKKRLQSISNILSHNPDIIVYGLDVSNFKPHFQNEIPLSELILHPKNLFKNNFNDIMFPIREKIPGSPKDRTLLTLKYILFGPEPHHHPFINFSETPITPINELPDLGDNTNLTRLDLSENSEQMISFKKLITEFKKNDIKVIVFSTPYHKTHVVQNDVELFEEMLQEFSEKNDIPVYFLHEKYSEMEIWRDNIHVAINQDVQIYTNDILEILLKEMSNSAI